MQERKNGAFMLEDTLVLDTEPTDIVFIIHGIGYNWFPEEQFKKNVRKLTKQSNKILHSEKEEKTILYVPIEWATEFHSLDNVDEIFKKINLQTVPTLRAINNNIISDCFFYFSEYHRQNILDIIYKEIYSSLEKIKKRWPKYEGKFGFIGHSLGGVIINDLLCNSNENDKVYKLPNTKFSSLGFKTSYFISYGSPIPAVNTMRGIKTAEYNVTLLGIEYRNLFHSHDPIAYKIEPLLSDEYKDLQPVILKTYVKKRDNKDNWASIFPRMTHTITKRVSLKLRGNKSAVCGLNKEFDKKEKRKSCSSINSGSTNGDSPNKFVGIEEESSDIEKIDEAIEDNDMTGIDDTLEDSNVKQTIEKDDEIIQTAEKEISELKRYDYCANVTASVISTGIDYIIGMRAHLSYWDNKDVIYNTLSMICEHV